MGDLEVRALTATTLGTLASPVSTPALVEALNDEDKGVRQSAWQALARITGFDLPSIPEIWSEALWAPGAGPHR